MSPPIAAEHKSVPLCVDLDGTLILTDLLWESLIKLLARNPLYIFPVLIWWTRGRAYLKAQIARRITVDMASLPYNRQFLEFVRSEKATGRRIVLVTASDAAMANAFAAHLGLFDEVIASDGKHNQRGHQKSTTLVERFGPEGFDYAGNSSVDLPVWAKARGALVVNGSQRLATRARRTSRVSHVFPTFASRFHAFIQVCRPHQWVKNLIIFVPVITAHFVSDPSKTVPAILAFLAFCLTSSGVYVLNDLCDVEADRLHPVKQFRPFARGTLALPWGLALFPLLLLSGAVLGCWISFGFAVTLAVYLVVTTAYSWRLKQIPLLDVFCLAGLYTVRLVAGHEATHISYSFWLLVFSMFLFLSLALVKRFVELEAAVRENHAELKGRGYAASDRTLVANLGSASGFMAVVVLALYVNSYEVTRLYRHPLLLLLICPLLLYWVSRIWLNAHRGTMHSDPIVFALTDRTSYAVGAMTLLVIWAATRF